MASGIIRALKRTSRKAGVHVWSLGFRAVGIVRRRVARWTSPGGLRVLVVAPHPDDEVVGCGGAILKHIQHGDRVCVLFATDGRRSRASGITSDEMARMRKREATLASTRFGVDSFEWIGLPEGDWQVDQLVDELKGVLARYKPDLLYAPSRIDFHPEHRRVASAVARSLGEAEVPSRVRVYQIQVPLTSILVDLVLPVGDVRKALHHVTEAYESQKETLDNSLRLKQYAARTHGLDTIVEEFWDIDSSAYRTLHRDDVVGTVGRVRGVRSWALTDPLAYLSGRQYRKALKTRMSLPSAQRFQ